MIRHNSIMIAPYVLVIVASIKTGCRHEAEKEPAVPIVQLVDFHHQHPDLGKVLKKVIDGFGMVNYEALKKDQSALESYLQLTASVPRKQFDGWTRPQRMAFLLNVYNASTLKLMADNFPVKSIKDIGGVRRVWNLKVVRLFGEKYTLGHLENVLIRKQFKSPSVHFALVCGSRSCPPLRKEPYTAEILEDQFADQAHIFLRDSKKNYVNMDSKTIFLSPIFSWFREDFGKTDTEIIAQVAEHFEIAEQEALLKGGFKIDYTKFDWGVNQSLEEKELAPETGTR